MGESTKIQWTDATWNPWQGCTKVSPACANCYMFRDMKRYGRDGSIVRRSAQKTFELPINRKRDKSFAIPSGWKVFTCSWSDWFHEAADDWRPEAWEVIRQRPDVTFQIVTKRTDRIAACLPADWGNGWSNVWLIATVENQEWADVRIPQLLGVPAVVHGLSMEPVLGPVDIAEYLGVPCDYCTKIEAFGLRPEDCPYCEGTRQARGYRNGWMLPASVNWVITGGESGPGARPSHPEWFRSIRDQCQAAGVPYFHKQNGEFVDECHPACHDENGYVLDFENNESFVEFEYDDEGRAIDYRGVYMLKVGAKRAGRLLDGREWSEFPAEFGREPSRA